MEALTHETYPSFLHSKGMYDLEDVYPSYEKLEVLGDAILDTIVNGNLVNYAFNYKINPFEIHHSKSNLVCNEILSKLVIFFGLQRYILSIYSLTHPDPINWKGYPIAEDFYPYQDNSMPNVKPWSNCKFVECEEKKSGRKRKSGWKKFRDGGFRYLSEEQKKERAKLRENEEEVSDSEKKIMIERYIEYFNYSFPITEWEIEYYEAPKIFGDVFEAIIGAVFVDGGYNSVVRVL